jgi:hypothetical protein
MTIVGSTALINLNAEFVERGEAKGLDPSCVGGMRGKQWVVAFGKQ